MNCKASLFVLLCAIAALAVPGFVIAKTTNSDYLRKKAIRMIILEAPGGAPDANGTRAASEIAKRMEQQGFVENRSNAGAVFGMAQGELNDYILGLATILTATDPSGFRELPYDALRDIEKVVALMSGVDQLAVSPAFPSGAVQEFVDLVPEFPDKQSVGSSGNGTMVYLLMELFKQMTGGNYLHAPYKAIKRAVTDDGIAARSRFSGPMSHAIDPPTRRKYDDRLGFLQKGCVKLLSPEEAAVFRAKRRLVAVLAADVVGYARLTEEHEENTHHWLMRLRKEVLDKGIVEYGGTLIKNTGDGFLAMFDSAGEATRCALSLQQSVALLTADQRVDQRISFRMAVNIAEAIIEKDDIYGDGVNVAARLQAYAEPGGVVVSGTVLEQVGSDMNVVAMDLGELQLRSLTRPVRTYALRIQEVPTRLLGDSKSGVEARPSIAVLPFRKYQAESMDEYFADGIVDDIVHALGGLSELFVISRGSTLSYGGSAIDTRTIGRELGVRYVLYGSVQRSGNRLRIGWELSDTESGTIIHRDRCEGDLADLFKLQDEISASVVKTIAPHVRDRELQRAMRKHPQNMTAYDFVLQALDVFYRMDHASFGRARGLLQQAITHDPDYAPAYAYSAYWYVFRVGEFGSQESRADTEAAARYAAAAIERDSNNALALAISGHVHSFFLKNFPAALAFLEKAITAGPNLPIAWAMSSATHGYLGDGATAVRHAEQAVRRSPLDALLFWHEGLLAQAHYVNGDYQEALRWARVAVAHNDSIRFNLRTLIAVLAALGEIDDARTIAQHLLQLQPNFSIKQYAARTPFQGSQLERRLMHLRMAGLPE